MAAKEIQAERTGITQARCVVQHISQSFANTPENSRRLMKLEGYLYMVSLGFFIVSMRLATRIISVWI